MIGKWQAVFYPQVLRTFGVAVVVHHARLGGQLLLGRILQDRLFRGLHLPLRCDAQCHLASQFGSSHLGQPSLRQVRHFLDGFIVTRSFLQQVLFVRTINCNGLTTSVISMNMYGYQTDITLEIERNSEGLASTTRKLRCSRVTIAHTWTGCEKDEDETQAGLIDEQAHQPGGEQGSRVLDVGRRLAQLPPCVSVGL